MLQRISTYILIVLCFSACKKESTVCTDENATNFNMEDTNGGATCEFAVNINEDLYGKWKVLYQLVYILPSNTTLNSLISGYSDLTYVEFEELYEEDYPLSEIEWAEFITGQLGLTFMEIETPEESTVFMEIEYTSERKVKYYTGSEIDNSLTHNWIQTDYDHLAYYTGNSDNGDGSDLVEIQVLTENEYEYKRVVKQSNNTLVEYRKCIKSN
ncbi:MAG: hypothetical protein ACI9B2_000130 [Flavobacteriales bacterium]|jgi:hypothetical protein|tara:strand:+ start:265 stop:903 length:639 start_codon:yes stop_codon:yes gene_type:complete